MERRAGNGTFSHVFRCHSTEKWYRIFSRISDIQYPPLGVRPISTDIGFSPLGVDIGGLNGCRLRDHEKETA